MLFSWLWGKNYLPVKVLDISVFIIVAALGILQGYHFCAGDLDTYLPFVLPDTIPRSLKMTCF